MGKKLYVGNLSYDIDNAALEQLFSEHGTVESANVIMDRDSGRSKGFGFVEMPEKTEAEKEGEKFRKKNDEFDQQRDELLIECQKAAPPALLTDRDLGFKEILRRPLDPQGAIENLKRLSIVTRVVKLLAESGVAEIVKITHDEPDRAGPEGFPDIIKEYSVQIVVMTRLDPLMKFLHNVRQPGKFFLVVRGLEIDGHDPYGRRASRRARSTAIPFPAQGT